MLEGLFGNPTAEQVLLYLAVNSSAYGRQMANAFDIPISVVQKQLRRLEAGGVLVSGLVGRTRVFSFNPRFPLEADLRAFLRRAFSLLPLDQRAAYESTRTRPRQSGKPRRLEPRGRWHDLGR